MNNNKLSTNLDTINTAVGRMRSTLSATNLDINQLANKVAEMKASLNTLESNMVYQVSSRAELAALRGMADRSVCLIKGTENRAIGQWDKFEVVHFPDRVVLSTPLADGEVINIGIDIKGTGHGTLTGSLSATAFTFSMIIKGAGASAKSITYIGNGGVYTRTDTYGSPITSAGELQWNSNYVFDTRLQDFFIADILLEEANIYEKGKWVAVSAAETTDLKNTVETQALTIATQTATNSSLNRDLATANATIAQQNITINEQASTITLQTVEIAALNARIEELENEQEPEVSEQTLLQHGEHLTAGTRLILPAVEPYEHSCSEINDLTLGTQLVYMNDGNAVLSIKNIENMGMTMVEVGPSSSDNMLTYMFEGEATNIGDLKVYTFDSGSLTNYDDEIGNIEIIVNRDTEVYFSDFYQTYLQDILPIYKM